jgi:hypothetical protein
LHSREEQSLSNGLLLVACNALRISNISSSQIKISALANAVILLQLMEAILTEMLMWTKAKDQALLIAGTLENVWHDEGMVSNGIIHQWQSTSTH